MLSAMAHLSENLRTILRDDLLNTLGTALRDELPKAVHRAMIEAVDTQIFESVDRMLDQFFNQEDMDCWMSFDRDGAHVLLGIGPGDCAATFEPVLTVEFNQRENISRDQEQEILDQIAGMKSFMAKLEGLLRLLEARAKVFTGRVHALPNGN